MRSRVRASVICGIALLALIAAPAGTQSETAAQKPGASEGSVPLELLLTDIAKRTGRKFIVDARVRADVAVIGQEPTSLDYAALLLVLRVNGIAAVEESGYVQVIPDANVRQYPLPIAAGQESYADAQYVNRLIPVKSASAAQLVPILRPLLPQVAHLVAYPCKNTLLVVDTFANVKRIEQIVRALDVGEPHVPQSCSERPSG